MKYPSIREEELKIKVGQDYFNHYDATPKIGNIDFWVESKLHNPNQRQLFESHALLWAEAKTGDYDVYAMFAQLVLTIGKERTFDKHLPPAFLGAFDSKKIAFIPYESVIEIFSLNDFNWNVTPSNHETKEFEIIKSYAEKAFEENHYIYDFIRDEKELKHFIKFNISKGTESGKILIDKNNFVPIYLRWLELVKPHINFDWQEGRKQSILDSDFYLADLFLDDHDTITIEDDTPIVDNLFVIFKNGRYEIAKENIKSLFNAHIELRNNKPSSQFWKKYKRPPLEEFQKYIIRRRDLLVPQDIRERKGAYFTPRIWVDLSQQYLSDILGNNWQEEFYIWDCAAGTGNLLVGLTNKYNIWASTLDRADLNVMQERIKNGANLLLQHVFQFDFLNDDFSNLPDGLKDIISDPIKREKLIVYINPPYAEADSRKGEGRKEIGTSQIKENYSKEMGYTKREVYIQFLTRIFYEISGCRVAEFSKLKSIQAPRFKEFRAFFTASLEKMFIVPANTFDNVRGKFPIGFKVWNLNKTEHLESFDADVYDENGNAIGQKTIRTYDDVNFINDWVKTFRETPSESIATIIGVGSDFQNQRLVRFGEPHMRVPASNHHWQITKDNLIQSSIYFAVRKAIPATWMNDREQFLFPKGGWQDDALFHTDCLTYTLFNNGFRARFGINNWIPFSEQEVESREKFASNFMIDFIKGEISPSEQTINLFSIQYKHPHTPLNFSTEAIEVFDSGRDLWKYYQKQIGVNVDGSLYDIREHFQGRDEMGRMRNASADALYMDLIGVLRKKVKHLSKSIEEKIYVHGFLKK